MIIYLDDDYKCHVTDDGTMRKYETCEFDGKCQTFIEGHRFVPEGETWTRSDGVEFTGLMVSPWKNYAKLEKAQFEYQIDKLTLELADADKALELLGVIV